MLVAPQFSRVQKREVTTYLVTPRDRGSLHCSIQQAIDKADPYSRIVLASGQYFESVTMQAPLEIVGEEGSEMPEVVTRGVCLSLLGDVETYFENVKFTTKIAQFGGKAASRNAGVSSVRITSGHPTFHKCHMTSLFAGGESVTTVTSSVITGNLCGSGLVVAEGASGSFTENTISNHVPFAVHVKSRGAPHFHHNFIFQDPKALAQMHSSSYADHQGGAVLISQDSVDNADVTKSIAPRFTENRIGDEVAMMPHSTTTFASQMDSDVAINGDFEQYYAERRTVVVENGCSPYFEENTITGGHIGVTLSTGSAGTFTNNTISHASVIGVLGGALSTTTFRFNVVSHCATGIFAQNTSTVLSQNTVKENLGSGLLLLVGPEDRFRMEGNSFVGNDVGISIRPSLTSSASRLRSLAVKKEVSDVKGTIGEAHLEKNYICLNRKAGILALGEGYRLTLQDLEVGANGMYGALCAHGANPTFRGVRFERGAVGVVVERCGDPLVSECTFTGHADAAILVRDRGRGEFAHNSITGFLAVGVLIDDGGSPKVHHNKIASTVGSGVHITHGGVGEVFENTIDTVARGISIASYGDPLVYGNKISSCSDAGVVVFDEGCGTILDNAIAGCTVGLVCSLGGECVVRGNSIKNCTRFGIVCSEGSRAIVEKNTLDSNVGGNILLDGSDSRSLVSTNVVTNSSGFGIRSAREAHGVVTKNVVSANKDGGLSSEAFGKSEFARNVCHHERGAGILVKANGCGSFEDNVIEDGEAFGVEIMANSEASIKRCVVQRNGAGGVRLHNGCGGSVRGCRVEHNVGPGIEMSGIGCHIHTVLDDLTIVANEDDGLRVQDHGSGKMVNCRFSHHRVAALFRCSGTMLLEHCTFDNNSVGVRFEKKGVAVVSACTFRCQSDADVEFGGEGRGTISHCDLGDMSAVAVLGSYNGGGLVVDSTIHSAVEAGCKFLKGSFTTVQRTTIAECGGYGIVCEEQSGPTVTGCRITACTSGNVKLIASSSPSILNNVIENSRTSGIVVESRFGRIEGNTIHGNEENGVLFVCPPADSPQHAAERSIVVGAGRRKSLAANKRKAAAPSSASDGVAEFAAPPTELVCCHNTIHGNEGAGVYFDGNTAAVLSANDIHTNRRSGVIMCAGSTPEFEGANKIYDNVENGIVFKGSCSANIKKATISHNDPCNVLLEPRSAGTLDGCDVSDAVCDGIRTNESIVQVKRCRIRNCANGSGIALGGANKYLVVSECDISNNLVGVTADVPGAFAKFTQNRFVHNVACGARIENGGAPDLTDNTFEGGTVGVVLRDGAAGIVAQNTFRKNAEGMVFQGDTILTVCVDNSYDDNDKAVVMKNTDASFVLERNTFGPNETAAVSCEEAARGTIRHNKFHRGSRGVLLASTASPLITQNHFVHVKCGVEVSGRSTPRVHRNVFSEGDVGCKLSSQGTGINVTSNGFLGMSVAGVQTEKLSNPAITRNIFSDCNVTPNSSGCLVAEAGCGVFSENDFHRNSVAIRGQGGGAGEFSRCMVHDNVTGAVFDTMATSVMDKCTFFGNTSGDVVVRAGAAPQVRNCFFTKNSGCSVQLLAGAVGSYSGCVFRDCQTSVLVEDAGNAVVSSNSLLGGAVGVLLRRAPSRTATIRGNVISGCDVGVFCQANGSAVVSQNFITQCEIGAHLEKKTQVKLQHNMFHKMTKHGILIKGNGAASITNNVVQDCIVSGMQVAVPVEKGGAVAADDAGPPPVPTSIVENVFLGSRVNVQLICGEVSLKRNHMVRGDFGLSVLPDARCTIDGNVVYDCVRASFTLGSRHCTVTNNLFYSLNDGGAFETSHDASPILSKDNGVYNSCSCKLSQPITSAPLKQADLEVFRGKDVLGSLQTSLLSLHTSEVPGFAVLGCSAIPGSGARCQEEEDDDAAGKSGDGAARRKGSVALLRRMSSIVSTTSRGLGGRKKSDGSLTAEATISPVAPNPPKSAQTSFRRGSTSVTKM